MLDLYTTIEKGLPVILGLIAGAALGSFLNVVIYRLPRRESIVFPGSKCPSCQNRIAWYDNIPVISFLLLGGKCRKCGARISYRYPVIELLTACMVVASVVINGVTLQMIADVVLGSILIASAAIDYDFMIIPNRLTYPGMILGLAFAIPMQYFGMLRALHGAIVAMLVLGFMFFLGRLLFKRDSMGFGDFKLAAVIGLFTGPFWTMVALVIAVFSGGIIGGIQLALKKKKTGQEVPFGPFLSLGGLAVIFFRPQLLILVELYLRFIHYF